MNTLSLLNPYFIRAAEHDFTALCRTDVTLMGLADPFYPDPGLPQPVLDAAKEALSLGMGQHYTMPIGLPKLRQVIAARLATFNGLNVDPDKEIIITPGSDIGLYYAMRVILRPGDEVLNPEPSYPANFSNVRLMGAENITVPLRPESNYELDVSALASRVTPRTKLVMLTQPNNPTGTVHSRAVLEQLRDLVVERNLMVIVDQAFEDIVFDGREFVTLASLPGMWERTISVFSTSKGMAMSGFRVGYNVACAEIMALMHASAVNVMGATNTFAQHAAIAAFENRDYVATNSAVFASRRAYTQKLLEAIPGVHCQLPQGTFMIWVDVGRLGPAAQVARYIADDTGVIVGKGYAYGSSGHDFLRIVFGALRSEEKFRDAIHRVAGSLRKLAAERSIVIDPSAPAI